MQRCFAALHFSDQSGLTLEIMRAVVAVVNFLSSGEPTQALPHITLAFDFSDDCHPDIDTEDDHQTDTPFDHHPTDEEYAEN